MASIQRRQDGRWRARYRDSSGKEHARHLGRKTDAQRWLDEVTTSVVTGQYVDPKAGRSTIGALAPVWLQVKTSRVKPKTLVGYQSLLETHVLPRWRDAAVSTITTADIEAWVSQLTSDGLSASRTRQAYLVLKGVLDTAVKARKLAVSPAHGVELPRTPQSTREYLTIAQLEALADAAGPHALLIRVLGYGGLRWGEAVGLTVRQCDLLRSRLVIDHAVTEIGGKLSDGTTKSGKRREIPLSRFLRDGLAAHVAGRKPDDLVFPAPLGGYLRTSNFRKACFDPSARAVGLNGLVPHSLRHTAASLAIQAGANIKVVQSMLGHASATMTWDLYGHLYDDDLDQVADRLGEVRERFLQTSCGLPADQGMTVVQLA